MPELLLAVLLMSVVGAVLMGVLIHQSRLYRHADDVMHAQRTLRAALDLVSSELRIASAGDLMAAEAESLSVRFDLWRAVVCDSTGADEATLFVYDSVRGANLPAVFRGTAYAGPYDSAFEYADGWSGRVSETGAGPESDCTARGAPAGSAPAAYRRVEGWGARYGTVPARGSRVRRYGRLSFGFRPSAYDGGTALWRNAQELVAPFESGARFLYRLDDGSLRERVPASELERVRMIRIEVVATGEGRSPFGARRSMTHDVWLRN